MGPPTRFDWTLDLLLLISAGLFLLAVVAVIIRGEAASAAPVGAETGTIR